MFNPQTVSRLTHLWCGVFVLSSIGCQTYSPYGYGNYPGNYGSPVYQQPGYGQPVPYGSPGMAPGGALPPGGGFQGGYPPPGGGFQDGYQSAPTFAPGTVTPATPQPNVPNGGYLPQGADASGDGFGQAGQFPGAGGNPPPPRVPAGIDRSVPDYQDIDTSPRRGPARTPTIEDEASFKDGINGAGRAAERLKNMETDAGNPPGVTYNQSGADAIEFTPPASRTAPSGIVQTAQHVESVMHTQRPLQPYGRAPNGQAWFRGLIDFDEQENLWYLIYNPEPGIDDPQGGIVTLVEHPHLSLLQGDDVVLVEGQYDPTQLDPNGRPKYRPNTVRRLIKPAAE